MIVITYYSILTLISFYPSYPHTPQPSPQTIPSNLTLTLTSHTLPSPPSPPSFTTLPSTPLSHPPIQLPYLHPPTIFPQQQLPLPYHHLTILLPYHLSSFFPPPYSLINPSLPFSPSTHHLSHLFLLLYIHNNKFHSFISSPFSLPNPTSTHPNPQPSILIHPFF